MMTSTNDAADVAAGQRHTSMQSVSDIADTDMEGFSLPGDEMTFPSRSSASFLPTEFGEGESKMTAPPPPPPRLPSLPSLPPSLVTRTSHTSAPGAVANDEDDDDTCTHFGRSNPFGPVDRSTGKTSKETNTSLPQETSIAGNNIDSGDDDGTTKSGHLIHNTVWTTVTPSGIAYRTTRQIDLCTVQSKTPPQGKNDQHKLAVATPLATIYERSVTLGPTERIIFTFHSPYDGSYTRTSEYIRPNGGSTTVRRQEFTKTGEPESQEMVTEYPPLFINSSSHSPRVSDGGNSLKSGDIVRGPAGREQGGSSTISELTNTLPSGTVALAFTPSGQPIFDDITRDPTTVDYNAGYDESVANRQKQNEDKSSQPRLSQAIASLGITPPRESSNPSGRKESNGWSIRAEKFSQQQNAEGTLASGADVSTTSSQRSTRRRKSLLRWACIFFFLAIAFAIAASVVIITRNKKEASDNGNTFDSSVKGGSDSDTSNSNEPLPIAPTASPTNKGQGSAPATGSYSDVWKQNGFQNHWPSEEGWLLAPSFATFVSTVDDVFDTPSSYYDAYYVNNAASCAERCKNAKGGAYFDLASDQNQNTRNNVCLCFREVECFDRKLEFSGGVVFVKDDFNIPSDQMCRMSTCGYFPFDPVCESLDIVQVKTSLDLELRDIEELMVEKDIRVFEEACASFLNDAFIEAGQFPVEGVRCAVSRQDLMRRQKRGLRSRRETSQRSRKLGSDGSSVLELNISVTGLFIRSPRFSDSDSVKFDENVRILFDERANDFEQNLKSTADEDGIDHFEGLSAIAIVSDSATPAPVPLPKPEPSEYSTSSPTRGPTAEPTQRPTRNAETPSSPFIDPCDGNPCRNGGTCAPNGFGSVKCRCRDYFTGSRCQTYKDPCRDSPCSNGGTCVADGSEFKCRCRDNFTGSRCQTYEDPCEENPCSNGGTCVADGSEFQCKCPVFYSGSRCQNENEPDFREFFWNDLPEEQRDAAILLGYNKKTWNQDITPEESDQWYECLSFRQQKALSLLGYSAKEWNGADAPSVIDCSDDEANDDPCDQQPCRNGGSCKAIGSSYECECRGRFSGPTCESYGFEEDLWVKYEDTACSWWEGASSVAFTGFHQDKWYDSSRSFCEMKCKSREKCKGYDFDNDIDRCRVLYECPDMKRKKGVTCWLKRNQCRY